MIVLLMNVLIVFDILLNLILKFIDILSKQDIKLLIKIQVFLFFLQIRVFFFDLIIYLQEVMNQFEFIGQKCVLNVYQWNYLIWC